MGRHLCLTGRTPSLYDESEKRRSRKGKEPESRRRLGKNSRELLNDVEKGETARSNNRGLNKIIKGSFLDFVKRKG